MEYKKKEATIQLNKYQSFSGVIPSSQTPMRRTRDLLIHSSRYARDSFSKASGLKSQDFFFDKTNPILKSKKWSYLIDD